MKPACLGYAAAVLLLAAAPARSQTPAVVNGMLETHTVTQSLEREIAAIASRVQGPAWVGYSIAIADRQRESGCWADNGPPTRTRVAPLRLEGSDSIYVLARIADRRIERIRVASTECPLDAGGLRLHWLAGVPAPDSLAWLEQIAGSGDAQRVSSAAVMVMALHADAAAADGLLRLARNSSGRGVRGNAMFWLAHRAGDKAIGALSEALDDQDSQIRTKAVFALSQLPKDEGVPKLIDLARTHRDGHVRRQAMFWLGQSGDPRALAFFEQVLRD